MDFSCATRTRTEMRASGTAVPHACCGEGITLDRRTVSTSNRKLHSLMDFLQTLPHSQSVTSLKDRVPLLIGSHNKHFRSVKPLKGRPGVPIRVASFSVGQSVTVLMDRASISAVLFVAAPLFFLGSASRNRVSSDGLLSILIKDFCLYSLTFCFIFHFLFFKFPRLF